MPLWVKFLLQYWQVKGLCPVCFLKWSRRLHDFLNTLPHPGYMHLKNSFYRYVIGFLILIVSCQSEGMPSKCFDVSSCC